MAVGTLLSSVIYPYSVRKLGNRISIIIMSSILPISFFSLALVPPIYVMYLLFFGMGVARSAISILNNAAVNIITNNSGKALNLLHCSFSVGAFIAPLGAGFLISQGLPWQISLYSIAILSILSTFLYGIMDYQKLAVPTASVSQNQSENLYWKNPWFYFICFLLFFYVGTENCINGWFVTYLKSTDIMSFSYSSYHQILS